MPEIDYKTESKLERLEGLNRKAAPEVDPRRQAWI